MINRHEDYWDRPFGGNDQTNAFPKGVAHFLSGFFRVLCKVLFRYEVKNIENVRAFKGKKSGAILVAPHVSYVDVVMMFISVRPEQWVRLIARDTLFEVAGGVLGRIISCVGSVPIKRDAADLGALKRAARFLKNGELIGLFPEGTRRGKGSVEPALHGGAALIARMGKAPIIPMGMTNIDKIKRKGKCVRFPKVTVTFGEPIGLASFNFLDKEDRLTGCVWYCLREAFALTWGCKPEEVDMKKLFPDAKDFSEVFKDHPIEPVDVRALPDYEPKEQEK